MRMNRRYIGIGWRQAVIAIAIITCLLLLGGCGRSVKIETCTFTESSKELDNPNRGFYYIHGFRITDQEEDYRQLVEDDYAQDKDTNLSLVEVNLQDYTNRAITEAGLANIDSLLCALEDMDRQLILRFLYDWDGNNEATEPENLEMILTHMDQLEPILRKHHKQFFTMQGLFIGNWGEMNGTKFLAVEDLYRLASKLADVTDESTYLSVRMPAQWRKITKNDFLSKDEKIAKNLKMRFGLFNDGMLGSESDYGTYGTESADTADWHSCWAREDELAFQNELCSRVPNGGEVIHENVFNDFDRAVDDLSVMHVTYLNRDYDREVFEKWTGERVAEAGCFSGMDGLSYIERHLGYRLLITDASLAHKWGDGLLSTDVTFQNVGFAPLYRDVNVEINLYSEEEDELLTYEVPQNLRKLVGGDQTETTLTIHREIPLKDLSETSYQVYLSIIDSQTGKDIFLANEQEREKYGYCIGIIDVY